VHILTLPQLSNAGCAIIKKKKGVEVTVWVDADPHRHFHTFLITTPGHFSRIFTSRINGANAPVLFYSTHKGYTLSLG